MFDRDEILRWLDAYDSKKYATTVYEELIRNEPKPTSDDGPGTASSLANSSAGDCFANLCRQVCHDLDSSSNRD